MRTKKNYLIAIFTLIALSANAQSDFAALSKPKVKIKWDVSKSWRIDFGVAEKNMLYKKGEYDFYLDYTEFEIAPSYEIAKNQKLTLGLKYRLRKAFNDGKVDEKRLTEQYDHKGHFGKTRYKGRFRFEQRFKKHTTFRVRYRFGLRFLLNDTEETLKKVFLTTELEELWSLEKRKKPSFGQRADISLSKSLTKKTSVEIGPSFRYKNYLQVPFWELVIKAGVSISL